MDEKAAKAREEALIAEKLLAQVARVFSGEDGMEVANAVLSYCHLREDVFRPNSANAYLQGMQAVGEWLFALLMEADFELANDISMMGLRELSAARREERLKLIDGKES